MRLIIVNLSVNFYDLHLIIFITYAAVRVH